MYVGLCVCVRSVRAAARARQRPLSAPGSPRNFKQRAVCARNTDDALAARQQIRHLQSQSLYIPYRLYVCSLCLDRRSASVSKSQSQRQTRPSKTHRKTKTRSTLTPMHPRARALRPWRGVARRGSSRALRPALLYGRQHPRNITTETTTTTATAVTVNAKEHRNKAPNDNNGGLTPTTDENKKRAAPTLMKEWRVVKNSCGVSSGSSPKYDSAPLR